MTEAWAEIAQWWIDAVRDDPRDADDLLDLLDDLVVGTGGVTLDLGCGEGQVMRHLGPPIVGIDASRPLLEHAARTGPVVHGRLPDLGWVRPATFARAVAVGVVELVEDHRLLFEEAASAVSPGGHLVVVMNHPVATAPMSEPLADPGGEILWRWGRYLSPGRLVQVADEHEIELFHRPVGELLEAAAAAGWTLERLIERGPSAQTVARFPEYCGQEQIPTLLGCRWTRAISS
jgi:SAM-dependent methyltransferase